MAHDPHIDSFSVDGVDTAMVDDLDSELGSCDVSLLLKTHESYDLDTIAAMAPLVFDTRGRMRHDNVRRL